MNHALAVTTTARHGHAAIAVAASCDCTWRLEFTIPRLDNRAGDPLDRAETTARAMHVHHLAALTRPPAVELLTDAGWFETPGPHPADDPARCRTCGHPVDDHPYRHPFATFTPTCRQETR